jgi:hypothetical protein
MMILVHELVLFFHASVLIWNCVYLRFRLLAVCVHVFVVVLNTLMEGMTYVYVGMSDGRIFVRVSGCT